MDIIRQYDNVGKDYIRFQEEFFSKKPDKTTRSIIKCLPKLEGKAVLDIGCGHGKDIRLYQSMGAKDIWGIDSSKVMVSEAKKNVEHPEKIFVSSIDKTPFRDGQFDVIIGRFSFHYLDDLNKGYAELARILRKGGVLIIAVDHPVRGLVTEKKKAYHIKENIAIRIYDNKVRLVFPTHTFAEYFSKIFFKHFYLEYFLEDVDKEVDFDMKKTPGFMTLKAIRR